MRGRGSFFRDGVLLAVIVVAMTVLPVLVVMQVLALMAADGAGVIAVVAVIGLMAGVLGYGSVWIVRWLMRNVFKFSFTAPKGTSVWVDDEETDGW